MLIDKELFKELGYEIKDNSFVSSNILEIIIKIETYTLPPYDSYLSIKIQKIKMLRDFFEDENGRSLISLYLAKAIIENWQEFKEFILKYKEMPKDYNSDTKRFK